MTALESIHPLAYILGGAALLRTTFKVTGLQSAALAAGQELSRGQPNAAHSSLRNLVCRYASSLSPTLVAAAAIEFVAEYSTDSGIAPCLAFAFFGVPGAENRSFAASPRGETVALPKVGCAKDPRPNPLPVQTGDIVNTRSETWWTHWGAMRLWAGAVRGSIDDGAPGGVRGAGATARRKPAGVVPPRWDRPDDRRQVAVALRG